VIDLAIGDTQPDLTLILHVPVTVSEARRQDRAKAGQPVRDRFEESDREFFERVEEGYRAVAAEEPERVKVIDATGSIAAVAEAVWECVIQRAPWLTTATVTKPAHHELAQSSSSSSSSSSSTLG
jgi:thymidylate kinase